MYTVLYVDAEPDLLELGKTCLEESGEFRVETAISADDGMRLIGTTPFDVIIADYRLPEHGGRSFLEQVRTVDANIPFILFTGKDRHEEIIDAINNGVDYYLEKGGDAKARFAVLREKIQEAVEHHRVIAEQRLRDDETTEVNRRLIEVSRQLSNQYEEVAQKHEELQEITREHNTFFDLSLDLLCIANIEGTFVRLNPEWERTLGYPVDELKGRNFLTFVYPDDLPATTEALRTLGGNTAVSDFVNRCRCKDGSYRWIEWRLSPYERRLIYAAARDITDRKKTEDALRRSAMRFRKIFEDAQIGMALSNPDFRFQYVNQKFCDMLGYSAEELTRLQFAEITHPDHIAADFENIEKLRQGKIPLYATEKRYMRKDGGVVWGSVIVSPTQDDDGTLLNFLVLVVDITERKAFQDALEQANRKLNLLSNITRHDILNQLTGLKGFITLSQQFESDQEKLRAYHEKALLAATTIERQINFTRDYEDMGMNAPVWQNLGKNISQAILALPMRDVLVSSDNSRIELFADPLFEKVFYNLIDNALNYGGDGLTQISVSARENDANLIIICEDNGTGISLQDKKKVFERGFGQHTGFGLFLIREILSITGMTITETGEPGNGARFEIVVPKGAYRFVQEGHE
jgi:PAS domain S-box-containing protein